MSTPDAILAFWFGAGGAARAEPRPEWFRKEPAFDAAIRDRFAPDWERAARGELSGWTAMPEGALALCILCDQFPRNMFRGSAVAFATDPAALAAARDALARGFDARFPPAARWFFYLPLEHSESLEDQRTAVALFERLGDDPGSAAAVDYARRHLAIIERFGRFPHRNAALGRTSTDEELEFLRQPGSRF